MSLGVIALTAMLKRGYDKKLVTGTIMAGGVLGFLIPPAC
ncbi:MAG: TRAP transporter large permease subunit [Oceanospirillales bacterium]|nr:TRAP transporter large permease subunit [Oceanospirillales bacterium]